MKLLTSGGRRFFMTMGCAVVNTLLLLFGFISEDIYQNLILGTVAVYVGGNTIQKVGEAYAQNDSEEHSIK